MTQYVPYMSKDFPIQGSLLRLDDAAKAWEEIDGRMRTAVRKAQKSGVVIREATGTAEEMKAFESFCLNPSDIPRPMTPRHHLSLAELDGQIVAGILLAEIGDKLFMLCHASTPIAKKHEIPSLLIWQVVERWSGKEFRHLDVGASYRASLQAFFSGWRTQPYPMLMRPPELKPQLMLTPFDTAAMEVPMAEDARQQATKILEQKFGGKPFTFFPRAMYAIYGVIRHLKTEGVIGDGGTVWVTTTRDTFYVSSCVTSAIEQTCPWTRELTPETRAIFVVHEFGFAHPRLSELRKIADERGIPLIEDCAYAWDTDGTGKTGDWIVYSCTKRFPVQFGGFLVGPRNFSQEELWNDFACSDENKKDFTKRRLAHWLPMAEADKAKRKENYLWYQSLFGESRTVFPWRDGTDPGAYVLKVRDEEYMQKVTAFVSGFGIEVGNYWKNAAIMLPVHQRLSRGQLEYIAGAVLATEREWCGVPFHP